MIRICIHCFRRLLLAVSLASIATCALATDTATPNSDLPERPLFRQFDTSHGLPSDTVHKLAQDADGNLWIATLDGLARYDGVSFRIWRHDPDRSNSLPQNDVQVVHVDEGDRIWVAVQDGGVGRYRPEHDDFRFWRHDPERVDSLATDRVWALASDGNGGLWAGGFRGLMHIDAEDRVRRLDPAADGACNDIVLALHNGADGTLWLGTAAGLCRYREGEGFQPITLPRLAASIGPNLVTGITGAGDLLWISSHRGLHAHAIGGRATTPTIPPLLAEDAGTTSVIEADGTVWYVSQDGIRRWQPERGRTDLFTARPGRTLALQATRFNDGLRDHEGSLWFASDGGGLAQLLPQWRAIRVYLAEPERSDALPGGRIHQLSASGDGRLWLAAGSSAGASEIDLESGLVQRWFVDGDGVAQPDASVSATLRDPRQRIWTGHRGHIARYTPDSGRYDRIERDDDGQALPDRVRRMHLAADDELLVAFGGGGLARINIDHLQTRFLPLGAAQDLPCAEVGDLRQGPAGDTWLACELGLLIVPADGSAIRAVEGAPAARVDGLAFDSGGDLWLHAAGILHHYRVSSEGLEALQSVGNAQGWPPVRAGGLIVDAQDVVWITSLRGLYGYDPARGHVHHYDRDDGLPSAEFSPTPPVALDRRRFAAGTLAGLVVIDTIALRAGDGPAARLRWHQLTVTANGSRQALRPDGEPIQLRHDHRELRLATRLDSFLKPAAHRYRYRLQGYDPDWVEQVGQPERMIERLPSGRYRLDVEAIGSDGQRSANRLHLDLHVGPPPWRQPWAIAVYAITLMLLLAITKGVYRRRLERRHALALAEERRHWAEQASEAKTRFLASIGHEIRTPMAGLLGMNALLLDSRLDDRQRHYARSVHSAGEHMLSLVNDLLDLSRIESGKLSLEPVPLDLAEVVDAAIAELGAAAEAKGLILSVRIEPGVPMAVVADGKRLTQILLNFLSNAIKFTPNGYVRLLLEHGPDRHCFAVQDDGPGLSEQIRRNLFVRYSQDERGRSSGGSGLGLAISSELATLMAGEVGADDSASGNGSRFWLRVPLATQPPAPACAMLDLPSMLVIDPEPRRSEDLLTSLKALGADAVRSFDPGTAIGDNAVIVMASPSAVAARAVLHELGLQRRRLVLSLPLTSDPFDSAQHQRVLHGPWRPRAVLAAGRELLDAATQLPSATKTAAATDLHGLHLLVVEDDALLREVLVARLGAYGGELHAVDNGLAALAAATAGPHHFDAIVLDLDLPELDGLSFLHLLRQRLGARTPPTVVVTARQHPDDEAQSLAAGAVAFLRKPVDPEALARRLRSLVRSG